MNRIWPENRLWTKDFACVCATNFFLIFNYQYLLVTLPIFLIEDLQGAKSQAGLIVAVFFIAAIVIRPFTGLLIERFGIRRVFYVSIALYLLPNLLHFFAASVISLLVLRAIHGLAFGMFTIALGTIAANIVPDARKGEGMGYYGLMVSVSMAVGPFTGLTAMYGWGSTIMFAVGLASVIAGIITAGLISLPAAAKREKGTAADRVGQVAAPARNKWSLSDFFEASALPISVSGFIFGFVYASIISFIAVYAEQLQLSHVSSYYFVIFAAVLLMTRPFTGRWFDRYGENVIMYPTIISFAAGLALLSIADNALLFLLSAALVGFGWGTIFPSSQTIAIQVAPPDRRGVATATFLFILDTGVGIGSFVSGMIGAFLGYSFMYLSCSIVVLIGLAAYYGLHGRKQVRRRMAGH